MPRVCCLRAYDQEMLPRATAVCAQALEDLSIRYDNTVRTSDGQIVQFVYGDDGLNPAMMEEKNEPMCLDKVFQHVSSLLHIRPLGTLKQEGPPSATSGAASSEGGTQSPATRSAAARQRPCPAGVSPVPNSDKLTSAKKTPRSDKDRVSENHESERVPPYKSARILASPSADDADCVLPPNSESVLLPFLEKYESIDFSLAEASQRQPAGSRMPFRDNLGKSSGGPRPGHVGAPNRAKEDWERLMKLPRSYRQKLCILLHGAKERHQPVFGGSTATGSRFSNQVLTLLSATISARGARRGATAACCICLSS